MYGAACLDVLPLSFALIFAGIAFSILYLCQYCDSDRDLPCIPGKGAQELKNMDRAFFHS